MNVQVIFNHEGIGLFNCCYLFKNHWELSINANHKYVLGGYFKCPSNCIGCGGLPDGKCYGYDDVSSGHPFVNPTVCKSWGGQDCKGNLWCIYINIMSM